CQLSVGTHDRYANGVGPDAVAAVDPDDGGEILFVVSHLHARLWSRPDSSAGHYARSSCGRARRPGIRATARTIDDRCEPVCGDSLSDNGQCIGIRYMPDASPTTVDIDECNAARGAFTTNPQDASTPFAPRHWVSITDKRDITSLAALFVKVTA